MVAQPMTNLAVVGVEGDQLVLVSEDGVRYYVPVTEALTDALRRRPTSSGTSHKTGPKEIQAHIRRGLSSQEVADLTGEELSYVQKFEVAVLSEREFVIDQALNAPVSLRSGESSTFGVSVRARLAEISATEGSWSAWREELGWRVEVVFQEGEVEHRARWSFDPRKQQLEPLNDDASVLSRHEPMPSTLIPKLQAVVDHQPRDRFDSEIFEDSDLGETGPLLEPVPYGRSTPEDSRMADTADLLEVLRRKRGEREPAPEHDDDVTKGAHPATGGIRLVDASEDFHDASVTNITGEDSDDDGDDDPTPPPTGKIKRSEMPSWDDIVFGAKSDEDPA